MSLPKLVCSRFFGRSVEPLEVLFFSTSVTKILTAARWEQIRRGAV